MQHKVDVQFEGVQVVATRGVVAHRRHAFALQPGTEFQAFECRLFFGVLREEQLDVVIAAQADEAGQLRSAYGNTAHAGCQVGHPEHLKFAAFYFMHDPVNGLGGDGIHSAFSCDDSAVTGPSTMALAVLLSRSRTRRISSGFQRPWCICNACRKLCTASWISAGRS